MMIQLQVGHLEAYAVIGRQWNLATDTIQRTCLRVAWRGSRLFGIGPGPERPSLGARS